MKIQQGNRMLAIYSYQQGNELIHFRGLHLKNSGPAVILDAGKGLTSIVVTV